MTCLLNAGSKYADLQWIIRRFSWKDITYVLTVNTLFLAALTGPPWPLAQAKAGAAGASSDTLKNLSAFLLLQRAEQKGFDPEKYGLTEDKAADYAAVFAKYDVNDDFSLEPNEICQLL